MLDHERCEAIVASLGFEQKLGYVAFCAERCLGEARRHPEAARQLAALPDLSDGVERIWQCAERRTRLHAPEIERLLHFAASFERKDPEQFSVDYRYDVALVQAARTLRRALHLIQDPGRSSDYVVGAFGAPQQAMSRIYEDRKTAAAAEAAIAETALQRLHQTRGKPFSRRIFQDIPEWPRGELSRTYTAGREDA